jgi:hypothetical protein
MAGGFFMNLFGWKSGGPFDERFVMHRFKSTRIAVAAGLVLVFALFTYDAVKKDIIRWDLFAIIAVMAVAKVTAMLYYRKTN